MKTNIEIKAYCKDADRVRQFCQKQGAVREESFRQSDLFFRTSKGRFKLRQDELNGDSLIFYQRLASPLPRQSQYEKLDLGAMGGPLSGLLGKALDQRARVKKTREVYKASAFRVNLDEVEGLGTFVEIEADVENTSGEDNARALTSTLMDGFGLNHGDLIPYSYAELLAMKAAARKWRAKLATCENPGKLFLLDGASCSGKTTITGKLLENEDLGLLYIPRYTTRDPRPGEKDGDEYIFISYDLFTEKGWNGDFLEYRDFEFGMSYGLPWEQSIARLTEGGAGLGIINLGSVRHAKEFFPEAVTILIDVPEPTILKRLQGRGINKPHEIEERLGNARRVKSYRSFYDHIVANDDGDLEACMAKLAEIMKDEV